MAATFEMDRQPVRAGLAAIGSAADPGCAALAGNYAAAVDDGGSGTDLDRRAAGAAIGNIGFRQTGGVTAGATCATGYRATVVDDCARACQHTGAAGAAIAEGGISVGAIGCPAGATSAAGDLGEIADAGIGSVSGIDANAALAPLATMVENSCPSRTMGATNAAIAGSDHAAIVERSSTADPVAPVTTLVAVGEFGQRKDIIGQSAGATIATDAETAGLDADTDPGLGEDAGAAIATATGYALCC
ncbi:hypothetical protein Brsp05_04705 [Brucella sp. NBRC 12953]